MEKQIFKQPKWILLIATLSCLLWGSAFPSLKVGYELLDLNSKVYSFKILFAGFRFFIASLMILSFAYFNKIKVKLDRKFMLHMIVLGVLQTTLAYILFYIGLSNTTGVKGSILIGTGTFFSIIFAHFYYHDDKLSTNKILGMISGFSGVVIINLAKGSIDLDFKLMGEGFLLFAAVMTAISGLYAKELSRNHSPVIISGTQMLLGSIILIFISGQKVGYNAIQFDKTSLLLLGYLSFISATAFSLWFTLIKHNKIGVISIYKFQIPIWGVLLSSLLLPSESLNINVIIALVFVVFGIVLVNLGKPIINLNGKAKSDLSN